MTLRVAVTTTADRFSRWADPLSRHGFEPRSLPCIEIRPSGRRDEARTAAEGADWLMITSPRVVEVLWPDGEMPAVPVAAVGTSTGEAVRAAGGSVALTGDGDGDRLVSLLMAEEPRGRRIAFPHGDRADTGRIERLRRLGFEVESLVVYRTVPIPPDGESVECAVFGSPTAVEGWKTSRALVDLRLVGAIGRTTAEALRRHGVESPVVPPVPSPVALAAELSATLERAS